MPGQSINQDIIAGKPSTYKDLQRRYFALVYDLVRNMGGGNDGENAKIVYSSTIVLLFEKVRKGDIVLIINNGKIYINNINKENVLLSTYLFKVAERIWLGSPYNPINNNAEDFLDDYGYEIDPPDEESSKDNSKEFEETVLKNYNKLSLSCQIVILLKEVCKVKHTEIAEFRGITHGAARNRFSECWENLRKGKAVQRQEKRTKPQKSKINVWDLLDIFLDKVESGENIWLLGELAEKEYYEQLPDDFLRRLIKIKSENPEIDKQLKLITEFISFLDEKKSKKLGLYKQDKKANDYIIKRNQYFETKYKELDISSRFMLLLHHVANTDKLKIAEFFKLEDDISVLKRIHECKLELADKIRLENTMYNKLINNTQHD